MTEACALARALEAKICSLETDLDLAKEANVVQTISQSREREALAEKAEAESSQASCWAMREWARGVVLAVRIMFLKSNG